jgi:type I restriction enzyme R subunit
MSEQSFEDYKSKYLDLYDKTKRHNQKEKVSILNDIDFELELIHRDEINVVYILNLLAKLVDATPEEQEKQRKSIFDIISSDTQLRSKRDLIEKFIYENLPHIDDSDDISVEFHKYWNEERLMAIENLSKDEDLDLDKIQKIIGDYLFTEKLPMRDDIIGALNHRPGLKDRASIAERVSSKILTFVETFINGIAAN